MKSCTPLFVLILVLSGGYIEAQNTAIPDTNFEQALVDLGIDTDGVIDGDVLTADISGVKELNVFDKNISDLTGIEGFTALERLNCSINKLQTLDVSSNSALISLNVSSNLLTSLDVASNPDLQVLNCQDNSLSDLDISNNPNVTDLNAALNDLATLDLTSNTALQKLRSENNRLTNLNVTNNPDLVEIICSNNQINDIDLSGNPLLETFFSSSNELTAIDLSNNTSVTLLDLSDNQLVTLDVSANTFLEELTCSANQLTSIDVSQNDSLRNLRVGNNQLSGLDVSNNVLLESLGCTSNMLTLIDLGANPMLSSLDASSNLFKSLDLRENPMLTSLEVSGNLLEYLNINNGTNDDLALLNAINNPDLTCIVVDDPSQPGDLWLKDTIASYSTSCEPILTSIADPVFEQFLIDQGRDSGAPDGFVVTDSVNGLEVLDVSGAGISDLTGIADFSSLNDLNCSNNLLDTLDLTQNISLTDIDCSDNLLVSLNIKNGSNASLINFDSQNNSSLGCITVDDVTQIGANWLKDAGTSYENNCNAGSTFVPDDNFELALIEAGIDTVFDNYVLTAAIDTLTVLDISGRQIGDLTGIEAFSLLDSLDCSSNLLFDLDISQNTSLTWLDCHSNFLTQLDVSANTNLISLNIGDNRLTQIDVSTNTLLEELIIDSNFLKELDIAANTALRVLNLNSNKVTSAGLDLSANTSLQELFCSNNKLATLDLTQNLSLITLDFSNNQIPVIDLSQNVILKALNCSRNFLDVLELSANIALDSIQADANGLSDLSFASNPLLQFVSAENNALTSIDLLSNPNLRVLQLAGNDLSVIDLSSNTALNSLDLDYNNLSAIDLTSNPDLLDLSLNRNDLTTLDLSANAALLNLSCNSNQLTELDISGNIALLGLSLSSNDVNALDLSFNSVLTSLSCDDNSITSLEPSANPDLESVSCAGNQIQDLDLSSQPVLTSINCSGNELGSLNLRNGNNSILEDLNATNNPSLLCIEIDDISMIGDSWQKDENASYSENCRYTDTYIPDDNFEAAVAAITGEPDDNDDYVATSAISGLTILDVSGNGIQDLTGIRAFISLESLDLSNNLLDSIDLGEVTNLQNLNVSNNNLDTLNLAAQNLLETLNISVNQINVLIPESLPLLTELICNDNNLGDLDLSMNPALTQLNVSDNSLTFLNVKNGNNPLLTSFDASGNPDLMCIEIDDPANIGTAWVKDPGTTYSMDCHYNETYVPDDAFEQALISLGLDETSGGPLDDYIPTPKAAQALSLNIANKGITDLTGIEDFSNLITLNISNNELAVLDIQDLRKLEVLNCSVNSIAALDLTLADSLKTLNVSGNNLTTLNVSNNTILRTLRFSENDLEGIDLKINTALTTIEGRLNNLVSVDINNGSNDQITLLDLRDNPLLTCVLVDEVSAAQSYSGWLKDDQTFYKLICDDDDNDGVADGEDLCPITPFGEEVDLFGCSVFSLPIDNFEILITDESCRDGNNGKINIFASAILPYTATLISELDSISTFDFGDQVEIRNVRAGRYSLCLTVAGQQDYEQCFSIRVREPEDLMVVQNETSSTGRVSFEMSGSSEYEIVFNGRDFKTTESDFSVTLQTGLNSIQITTPALCQGVFQKQIYYGGSTTVFPNPFNERLSIGLSNIQSQLVQIKLYDISGALQYSGNHKNENGTITLDMAAYSEGIYILELIGGKGEPLRFKAVKR